MNKTIYEQGRQEGRQEGQRMMLRDLVENRFGPLTNSVLNRIEQLPVERIVPLAKEVLRASSLKDLGLED